MSETRKVRFAFEIPFGGNPADTCEKSIRDHVTYSLLNSLSEIHPDIRCTIEVEVAEELFQQRWNHDERRWEDVSLSTGEVRT